MSYSFNYADEHFNDIIRKNIGKGSYVVNPDAKSLKVNLSEIYDFDPNSYTRTSEIFPKN